MNLSHFDAYSTRLSSSFHTTLAVKSHTMTSPAARAAGGTPAYSTPTKRPAFAGVAESGEAGPSRARPSGASPAYVSRPANNLSSNQCRAHGDTRSTVSRTESSSSELTLSAQAHSVLVHACGKLGSRASMTPERCFGQDEKGFKVHGTVIWHKRLCVREIGKRADDW